MFGINFLGCSCALTDIPCMDIPTLEENSSKKSWKVQNDHDTHVHDDYMYTSDHNCEIFYCYIKQMHADVWTWLYKFTKLISFCRDK